MRIELTHDILAQKVYQKVSAEEKALRKMERFVADRFEFYHGKGHLLTSNELNYISPYLQEVDLGPHLIAFVQRGLQAQRRRRAAMVAVLAAVFLILMSAAGVFAAKWRQAEERKRQVELLNIQAVALRDKAEQDRVKAEDAMKAAELARDSVLIAKGETEKERDRAKRNEEKEYRARQDATRASARADSLREVAYKAKDQEAGARKDAEENLRRAIESEKQAFQFLRLTIAQALAAKSRLLTPDSAARKGRLALKAWQLHDCNGGRSYDQALLPGLYYSYKALVGNDSLRLAGHTSTVRSMVARGGRIYTTGSDGRFLQHALGAPERARISANAFVNRALALSPDGMRLLGGSDQAPFLQVFSLENDRPAATVQGQPAGVWDLVWGKNGFFVAGVDGMLRFSPHPDTRLVSVGRGNWRKIALSPDGRWLATVSEAGGLQIWDAALRGDSLLPTGNTRKGAFMSVAWSGSGKYLAAGSLNGSVYLWEIQSRPNSIHLESEYVLTGHRARVPALAFSGDSLLASGSYDRDARLWYLKNGVRELLQHLPLLLDDHTDWVESLAFTDDGSALLAGCKNGLIRKWPLSAPWLAANICARLSPQTDLLPLERSLYLRDSRENLGEDDCAICPSIKKRL